MHKSDEEMLHDQIVREFYVLIEETENAETEKLKIWYLGQAQGILHIGIVACILDNEEIRNMEKICKELKTWEWI